MSPFLLPPIEAFLDAHHEYIDQFGGDSGVSDLGRLEAALGRAQSLIDYGDEPTIFDIAAIVAHHNAIWRDLIVGRSTIRVVSAADLIHELESAGGA